MNVITPITDKSSEASLYEMLAEEAAELSAVASKYVRILRGEQPVKEGLTKEEVFSHIIEEYSDVNLCTTVAFAKTLDDPEASEAWLKVNDVTVEKLNRWAERLEK